MYKQRMNSTVVFIMLISFLLSSCTPPVAQIMSITHDPEFPKDGEAVSFIVNYQNTSQEQALSDVVLEVNYDSYLVYSFSNPQADEINQDVRKLAWHWSSLQAGEAGRVEIGFMIQSELPLNVYRLALNATIQGKNSEGNLSQHSQQTTSFLEGRPTPTSVVENYEYEFGRVTLELPWQESDVPIHSKQLDFDTALLDKPVQETYTIIMPIIHLAVYDDSEKIINEFKPPIILTAQYDLNALKEKTYEGFTTDQLAILIFDSGSDLWTPYTPTFSESGGSTFATISITSWTSPAIWGCKSCPK